MKQKCVYCRKELPIDEFKQIKNPNKVFSKCRSCRKKFRDRVPAVLIEMTCVCCKIPFRTKLKNQKLCSRDCASVYNSFEYKCKNGGIFGLDRFRFEVFKRDNFTCQYCGRNVKEDKIKIELEHIVPKSKGGKDTLENFTTACRQCNAGKHAILLESVIK